MLIPFTITGRLTWKAYSVSVVYLRERRLVIERDYAAVASLPQNLVVRGYEVAHVLVEQALGEERPRSLAAAVRTEDPKDRARGVVERVSRSYLINAEMRI
jgi:hypothetical protein